MNQPATSCTGTTARETRSTRRRWKSVIASRLCWRVVFVVFLSILGIEAVILLPSYRNYERDLLLRVEHTGHAALKAAYTLAADYSPRDALLAGQAISHGTVKGGTLYSPAGKLIGSFGERPRLTWAGARNKTTDRLRSADGARYDVLWEAEDTSLPFTIVGRLDSGWVDDELDGFLGRISALILIISVFVTAGTLLALGRLVLTPVLTMRQALNSAREDPVHADRFVCPPHRSDELGDMTETLNGLLRRVAATYREELATLDALVHQAQDGIVVYDAHGGLLYANAACLRMCGCPTVDRMRRAGQPRIYAASELLAFPLTGALEDLAPETETFVRASDGNKIPCLVRSHVLTDDDGEILRYFAILSDISAIRAVQEKLGRQNIELAAANRAKSDFLANMSHELRTPLNAIIGFSEIIKGGLLGPVGDRRYRHYASDIHQSGQHLLSIINDILDLAKIESGNMTIEMRDVNLAAITNEAVRMMRQRIADAGLQLEISGTNRAHSVNGDERSLKQVILNLVSNAIKFTRPGGRISIELTREDGEFVTFRVSDTGCGIREHDLQRITQPFMQVESSLARRHDGTGLGLALVTSHVELNGGTLRIESEVNVGTTVSVLFPIAACEPMTGDNNAPARKTFASAMTD